MKNTIKQYISIVAPHDGCMKIVDINTDLSKAKISLVDEMYREAVLKITNCNREDIRVTYTLWICDVEDKGMHRKCTITILNEKSCIVEEYVYDNYILFYDTETQKDNPIKKFHDICNDVFKSDVTEYHGIIGPPSHPQNEYMEYNLRYLSTKLKGDNLVPILNTNEFKWGSPYMIIKDNGRVYYGIAAYISTDETTVTFITTYDELGNKMFGRPLEINVTVKDLCNSIKIKYIGGCDKYK